MLKLGGMPGPSSQRWRARLISVALALGCTIFAHQVNKHYPLRHWLFFRYLQYWAASLAMTCACMISGIRVVGALGASALSLGESLLLAFACGVLLFGLGIFAGGLLGLYGPIFFFVWPILLTLAGGVEPWRKLARIALQLKRAARDGERWFWPGTTFEYARAAFLVVWLVALYLQVLTPENVSFDSRWYHLGIAQQYTIQGGIERFPEGWYLGAYPQLATWLYTWAFQLPGDLFDHVSLASHLEWVLFLATVPGVGLVAKHLVPRERMRWTGAVLLLFPSLYLYDTNLTSSADHALAFWAAPLALGVVAAAAAPSPRRIWLACIPAAGALLTRYQALYLLAPAGLFLGVALVRARRFALILHGVGAALLLTSPHWLKNLIYYGDPLYPMLHAYLPLHPFHENAAQALVGVYVPTQFSLEGTPMERVVATLRALPMFSFIPHNWGNLNLPQPTFGSMFTLLGMTLPLLWRAGRIWLLMLATYMGVAIWFWTNHQDRFLQGLLPWMAACVVALCVRIWKLGWLPQLALSALVGLQLVWGADFYFAPNHTIINDSILSSLARHLNAGIRGDYEARFEHWTENDAQTRLLPRDAVVLIHNGGFRIGYERRVVSDEPGYQGAISYAELRTPRAVWEMWRALGVTHVYWKVNENKNAGADERAREAVFRQAVKVGTQNRRRNRDALIAELSPEPPPEQ